MSDLIEARWVPAFPVQLPSGRVVEQGDIVEISAGEAKESDNWAPVKTPRAKPEES